MGTSREYITYAFKISSRLSEKCSELWLADALSGIESKTSPGIEELVLRGNWQQCTTFVTKNIPSHFSKFQEKRTSILESHEPIYEREIFKRAREQLKKDLAFQVVRWDEDELNCKQYYIPTNIYQKLDKNQNVKYEGISYRPINA